MMVSARRVQVEEAARLLMEGRLVVIPTETVYGLAAAADHTAAVAAIFKAKDRPSFNPLICHLHNAEAVFALGRATPLARRLADAFWPGPLAMLLPHEGRIPSLVTAGSDYCAFRVPDHGLTLELLRLLGRPLAAPSANRSGRLSPTTAEAAVGQLGDRVAAILDGGPCAVGVESTVVHLEDDRTVRILRPGGVSAEDLMRVGVKVLDSPPHNAEGIRSPGTTLKHYAPRSPMIFVEPDAVPTTQPQSHHLCAFLAQQQVTLAEATWVVSCGRVPTPGASVELSPDGNDLVAARELFSVLRRLDREADGPLIALGMDPRGLGQAINDRLRRGAVAIVSGRPGGWKLERQ